MNPSLSWRIQVIEVCFISGRSIRSKRRLSVWADRLFSNTKQNRINIRVTAAQLPANIELLSLEGRVILQERIHNEYTSLSVSNVPQGIYLHKLIGVDKQVHTGKLWID